VATISKVQVKPRETISGNSPKTLVLPEGANVTAKAGELAVLSSGYVAECSDNPSNIFGFFAEDAHNDDSAGTHNIAVYLADPDTIFCGNVYNGVAGSDAVLAQADVGRGYGLYRDTTNSKVYVSKDAVGSNIRVIVQELVDAVGDTAGRVLFRVIQKYYQLLTTS
jgi:hypothetical protein